MFPALTQNVPVWPGKGTRLAFWFAGNIEQFGGLGS